MTFPNAARPSSFADGSGICGSAYKIIAFSLRDRLLK
jgi:hypothetical protein